MFSDACGGRREHYVDLFADEEARLGQYKEKQSCLLAIEEVVERLREQSCIHERIVTVEEFDEPTGPQSVLNVLAKSCYFVVVQTASYWWSLERRDDTIVIQRSRNFSSVHSRCRGSYRSYRWLLETAPTSQRSVRCRRGPKLVELFSSMLRDHVFDAKGCESSSWEFSSYVFDFCLYGRHPSRTQAEVN
ncbi:hypothetical protein ABB37_07287 [Leptomonas pyrrhocoris]|uniref:Uncharacterized protein n=1 Tax=Leptomonas pyrrhocoris TaxID=157538 RepID=A0A0N0DT46_LEPPY|nr:hypothetical protein ABB37_07287 [Leptomonas pyrrhocoris]KPA76898.1 hypothetical protein ABB37_07287 [Leptomonas pyrrhocoris]|eukprot:XP_015655337.1 hypothetical protein ABB37_07287 [Leptomonas pyrrhocoris]